MEKHSAYLTYNLIHSIKPARVVETGVADCYLTFFILYALKYNGHGRLTSFNISEKAGSLLTGEEKAFWNFKILGKNRKKDLLDAFSKLGGIEMFIHDSNHSYSWQTFEYNSAYLIMNKNSVFMSDEIYLSYAFVDFRRINGIKPMILVEPRKIFGCFKL